MTPADDSTAAAAAKIASGERDIDRVAIDTIRTLSMDAVQKANSGHPGTPMALAPVAYTLWSRFMNYDPAEPAWPNRDRFVLSAGHACMLLYSVLHLAGVARLDKDGRKLDQPAISLDDIKSFRQLDSICPGHPEYGHTTGVEITTGPLGQGCGDSVGMAIAERWLASRFNTPELKLFDYNVYVICSDGDMEEGVASEAASIAGHLKLSNLCWIYDDNTISIEGHTEITFTEDVAARFRAYGWNTLEVPDANDCEAMARALNVFKATHDRPTLIVVRSVIGYGAPHRENTAAAHGEALGEDEVRLAKLAYGWPEDAHFLVPDGVRERFAETLGARGAKARQAWEALFQRYGEVEPARAEAFGRMRAGWPPDGWQRDIPTFPADAKGIASREASGKVLNAIAPYWESLVGGAADLSPSTKTNLTFDAAGDLEPDNYGGRNMHFGIREHAMGAIANGMAVSKLRPYASTFLIFSDYMKGSMRLAALMGVPVTYVFTHDSIGLGEDGPTHQAIEQLATLRATPDMLVFRPCDANETAETWRAVLGQSAKPAAIALSRQALPTLDREKYAPATGVAKGGYVLAEAEGGAPDVILIATGSEVSLCVEARETLAGDGVRARVVSLPCWELFEAQDQAYRDEVLPPDIAARVTVEAAAALGWDRYAGPTGTVIAMRSFGASAPGKAVMKRFGFTAEAVYEAAKAQVERERARR
ncbi:MAG TPA: transketolase [Caulobacteraceae bacterium]|jgi:transketolase|nr:transketolase [Caulobacteraceae bacterium]